MIEYNKQVATDLLDELQEALNVLREQIKTGPEKGPGVNSMCEYLGKAINCLKTTVR